MNSSRLPGKHLLIVREEPIIQFLIKRLKNVSLCDRIILATTDKKLDDPLVDIAKNNKIDYFRGDEDNVMSRVLSAANFFSTDIIVSITADCPLVDPKIIDECISNFINNDFEYLNNLSKPGYPGGMNCQVYFTETLSRSYSLNKNDPESLEHVTLHIRKNPNIFSQYNFMPPSNLYFPNKKYELDIKSDYLKLKKIIEKFRPDDYVFTCKQIIEIDNET